MAYLLDGTIIRSPLNIEETTKDLYAQQTTLNNSVNRDYFGSTKRVWVLDYTNTKPNDHTTIKTISDSYKSTGTTKTWQSTETNYTIASTRVHIDLIRRRFNVRGNSYISDFSLVLTEA